LANGTGRASGPGPCPVPASVPAVTRLAGGNRRNVALRRLHPSQCHIATVAAVSGVPVSALQYYFGSREGLLVAAFRHASSTEIAALETEVASIDDPWEQLETILTRSLAGYEPEAPDAGRLWIESWHFGIGDPEMRADALRDNTAWRRLVAGLVQRGIERGTFSGRYEAGRSRCSPWPRPTAWASRCRSATRTSPQVAPYAT